MKYSELKILFATVSPRRRALAHKIKYVNPIGEAERICNARGILHITPVFSAVDADEVTLTDAVSTATANARIKGELACKLTDLPVLAFDTVVGLGDKVFGKPKDRNEAIGMFKTLCGSVHEVVTAVYLRTRTKIIENFEKTLITFGTFDEELVYNYVDSGAPYDKAGGYNIDDAAIAPLIIRVDGDRNNVVGLPVALTEKLIEENLIYVEDGYCS